MGLLRPGEVQAPPIAPGSAQVVVLGRFGAPFGVQGWIKVESYTEPPEQILEYRTLRAGAVGGGVAVQEWKRVGKGLLAVRIEGIASRDAAVGLRGTELWVRRAELPPTAPGEYYFADLIGLSAVNLEGDALGQVAEILELPAHPVLVLRGGRERLVPLVPERLIKVDLDAGRVTLDWHRDD
jgi:16S rRNA processing protein RimM